MRVRRGFAALCALGLWPALAAAQTACPNGIAHDGIWLEYADRTVATRVLADGRNHETEYSHEGGAVHGFITLAAGLVTESWALVDGRVPVAERETVRYEGLPDPLPHPAPGLAFEGVEIARLADGRSFRSEIRMWVSDAIPFAIGPCLYTGYPVTVSRRALDGGALQHDSMMHLRELEVTIYLGYSDTGAPAEASPPVSISLVPPIRGAAGAEARPSLSNAPSNAAETPKK